MQKDFLKIELELPWVQYSQKEHDSSLEAAHREINIVIKQHFVECLGSFETRIKIIMGTIFDIVKFNICQGLKQNLIITNMPQILFQPLVLCPNM